jgi:hypothetical protein
VTIVATGRGTAGVSTKNNKVNKKCITTYILHDVCNKILVVVPL